MERLELMCGRGSKEREITTSGIFLPRLCSGLVDQDDHPLKIGPGDQVPVLVYVDEERVIVGPPREEYILRMNRAIREAAEVDVSKQWLQEVLRKFIPATCTV